MNMSQICVYENIVRVLPHWYPVQPTGGRCWLLHRLKLRMIFGDQNHRNKIAWRSWSCALFMGQILLEPHQNIGRILMIIFLGLLWNLYQIHRSNMQIVKPLVCVLIRDSCVAWYGEPLSAESAIHLIMLHKTFPSVFSLGMKTGAKIISAQTRSFQPSSFNSPFSCPFVLVPQWPTWIIPRQPGWENLRNI